MSCLCGTSSEGFSTFSVVLLKTRPLLVTRLTSAMLTTDGNGISLPFSMNVALYLYGIALSDSYGTGPGIILKLHFFNLINLRRYGKDFIIFSIGKNSNGIIIHQLLNIVANTQTSS